MRRVLPDKGSHLLTVQRLLMGLMGLSVTNIKLVVWHMHIIVALSSFVLLGTKFAP